MKTSLRRRTSQPEQSPAPPPRDGAKNRATPKRAQARARRGRALAQAPTSRREARSQSSANRRQRSQAYRESMLSTDVSKLPARERAPERVIARDVVDRRPSAGPILLAGLVVEVLAGLSRNSAINRELDVLLLAILAVFVVDSVLRVAQVRRAVRAQIPHPTTKVSFYAVSRSLMPKRWRRPISRL